MKFKHYILLLLFVLLSTKDFAWHIVGGEIYYDCLGGNNYRITLKLYRDCYTVNGAQYDDPATIFIFDSLGTFLDSTQIAFPGSDTLPFPLNNPCLAPPTDICVEESIYQTIVNLPPLAGGYNIVYQRCCRNSTILNLINPATVGSSYMAHIPDPGLAACNSSPHYNNFPPIFLCAGVPLNFDHSATDPDGDSLHYELCDPYTGLTSSCPILGPQAAFSGCPEVAVAPPYPFVPWLNPYNGSYPMSSSPALAVDPVTGLMTGTPNMVGQWVIGVCVEEYRNGVLLSTNKRDFQFNVVNCGIPVASIPTQQPFCFGLPSNFSQNSINAFTYHWDFGETGMTNDTSNQLSPSWTYSALGTYTVELIVNPFTLCSDTASLAVTVYPLPSMTSSTSATICSGDTLGIPLSSTDPATFSWVAANNLNTTGESTSAQTGTPINNSITNNSAVVQTVSYNVTPTSNPGGCVGSAQTVTVTVNPAPTMTSPPSTTICNGVAANHLLTSNLASTYTWIAGNNTNTTGESTTSQTGNTITDAINNSASTVQQVTYTVTPTSTANGCTGAPQSVTVDVIPVPAITSAAGASICSGGTVNVPLTSNVPSSYTWVAADNPGTTGESTTQQTGSPVSNTLTNTTNSDQLISYTITPTSSPNGCPGTPFTMTVTVYHGITADFDFVKIPCVTQVAFNDSSAAAPVSWLWYFGDGDSSNVQNPSHTYDSTGVYDVQLITSTVNGCSDTTVVQVDFVGPNPVSVSTSTAICLGNSTQLNATGGFAYSWAPGTSLNDSTVSNPVATPADTTDYTVTISTVDTFGDTCSQTLTTTVYAIDATLYTIAASSDDDTIAEGQSTTLHAITDSILTVNWSPSADMNDPNSFNPSVSPSVTTTYYVSILDSAGCPKRDSITVYVVSQKCEDDDVFVPNTFTPNGDGVNDILFARGNNVKKIYFAIYNRRGELIFETNTITKGWDGIYQGRKADPDVFAWYIKATCYSDLELEKKGNITLIR